VLRVKVASIRNPLSATPFQRRALPKGSRFVGVRLTLVNAGKSTWTGSPAQASTLLTNKDTQAAKGGVAGQCGGAFATRVEISPDSRQRGCLVFVLDRRERPATFQFSASAPAALAGEWKIPRRRR